MLENKLFGVISLGCDKNRVDSEKLIGLLKERKCALTDDLSKAQIVIVNTCAFLESARKESIETILECAGYKKSGKLEKIVVTGCLPQKFIGELFDPLTEADVFLGIRDYEKIFEALEKSYERNERENYVGKGSDGFRSGGCSLPNRIMLTSKLPTAAIIIVPTASFRKSAADMSPIPWKIF